LRVVGKGVFGHPAQWRNAERYLRRLAAEVDDAPGTADPVPRHSADYESAQHFLAHSAWDPNWLLANLTELVFVDRPPACVIAERRDLWQPEASRHTFQVDQLVALDEAGEARCTAALSGFGATAAPRGRRRAFDFAEVLVDAASPAWSVTAYYPVGDITRDRLSRRGVPYALPIDAACGIWTIGGKATSLAELLHTVGADFDHDELLLLPQPVIVSTYAVRARRVRERVYLCRQPDGGRTAFVTNVADAERLGAMRLSQLAGWQSALDRRWSRLCRLGADRYRGRTVVGHAHHLALVALLYVSLDLNMRP
jgi:hypothetical protein